MLGKLINSTNPPPGPGEVEHVQVHPAPDLAGLPAAPPDQALVLPGLPGGLQPLPALPPAPPVPALPADCPSLPLLDTAGAPASTAWGQLTNC